MTKTYTTASGEIATRQIEALRDEAAAAGDVAMAEICEVALDGDEIAIAERAAVIARARRARRAA